LLASFALVIAVHAQETIQWSESDPRCSHRYWESGLLLRSITQKQITVAVALGDRNGHYELSVIVTNERATSIDVLTENFAIWSATDRNAKIIRPLPLSKVVPKLYYKGIEDYVRWLKGIALSSSTVDPHKTVAGAVFFPRENKKHNDVIVYLPIGGDTLEFEMSPQFQ
jgi:hypothetical protein